MALRRQRADRADTQPPMVANKVEAARLRPRVGAERRATYLALFLAVIILGLLSRKIPRTLPMLFSKYPGDLLWAVAAFFLISSLVPRITLVRRSLATAVFCICIEFAKLYQADWAETVRSFGPGRLLFGYQFSWINLGFYMAGVALAAIFDHSLICGRVRS